MAVGLIVNEIVSSAELEADAERVRARIEEMAAGYAEPQQVINYYLSNAEQRQQIEMAVLEDQVVDHILDSAQIEEVASNYNDVISGRAIAPEVEEGAEDADASDSGPEPASPTTDKSTDKSAE